MVQFNVDRILFAARLRRLRQAQDLTIRDLAKLTGLSQGFLSELENGAKSPGYESLGTLAKALG